MTEIEAIEATIRTNNGDKSAIYASAKETGFDTKAIRHLIKMRRMEKAEREAFEHAFDAYQLSFGFDQVA